MSAPKTTKAWTVEGTGSFDSLKFDKERAIPEFSDNEVLVKFHAASLNYRDVMIPLVRLSLFPSPSHTS
jgi:NADPH:quinone reductase-like Zn-dependent oxidoreductase